MSYDLLVFDPSLVPLERQEFLEWWKEQSEWSEDHDYDDPAVSTPSLRAWFLDIAGRFPPLNGPHAPEETPEDDASQTDYSVGRTLVYAAFPWPKAESAYDTVFALAEKHGLGFFDASSEQGAVWLPGSGGKLAKAHEG